MKKWFSFEKKKVRISRPARKILLGTGIAFFSGVFVIGLLTLFYFGVRIMLVWIHVIDTRVPEYNQEKTIDHIPLGLTFNSFSDLFSGEGRVSLEKSSRVYWGRNETAFISPPLYEWNIVENKKSSFSPSSCFSDVCITREGTSLVLNNETLILPFSSSTLSTSYHTLSKRALIGQVVEKDDEYEGYLYTLDTRGNLEEVFSFSSPYRGSIGIGGDESEWMVVYGAYEGKAWYISSDTTVDLSHLFSFRMMNGGFYPHIIKGERGWYVMSEDSLNPKLIKVFGSPTPYGVIDFSPLLFTENIREIQISSVSDNMIRLYSPFTEQTFSFIDRGFSYEKAEIISENINVSFTPTVYILLKDMILKGALPTSVAISPNGEEWADIKRGDTLSFSSPTFFWKVVIDPQKPFFFDKIQFDYWTE